jgi:Flp pilus assembly protein TadG
MNLRLACKDDTGTAAVEFGITAPAFFMLIAGVIGCSLLLWTQLGLQHGTEMAARCASVNTTLCGSTSAIQSYAAQQSLGLHPPASTFTVSNESCGHKVSASYAFQFLTTYFGRSGLTITAGSCFPS